MFLAQRLAVGHLVELDLEIFGEHKVVAGSEGTIHEDVNVVHVVIRPISAVAQLAPVTPRIPDVLPPHHVRDPELCGVCHQECRDLVAIIDAGWVSAIVVHHDVEGLSARVIHDRVLPISADLAFFGVVREQVLHESQQVDGIRLEP